MSDSDPQPDVGKHLIVLQLIVGALMLGAAVLAGITAYMRPQFNRNLGDYPMISVTAAGMALTILVIRPFVLSASVRSAREKLAASGANLESDAVWMPIFAGRTISGSALLEGPIFVFFIAYMLQGEWWALASGVALMAMTALLHFPSKERAERWIGKQREAERVEKGTL